MALRRSSCAFALRRTPASRTTAFSPTSMVCARARRRAVSSDRNVLIVSKYRLDGVQPESILSILHYSTSHRRRRSRQPLVCCGWLLRRWEWCDKQAPIVFCLCETNAIVSRGVNNKAVSAAFTGDGRAAAAAADDGKKVFVVRAHYDGGKRRAQVALPFQLGASVALRGAGGRPRRKRGEPPATCSSA